jgi:hypothetical protein
MLYLRTDDVERLQKVIADTEQQFVKCLQQIKTLGEEKGAATEGAGGPQDPGLRDCVHNVV